MIVLVLAGGYDQIALINELKNRGAKVILVDFFDNPPAKKVADKHYKESTLDVLAVKKIAIIERVNLITTACTDQALLTVAQVSEELNLPCYISYNMANNVTNKSYMKDIMVENDIPTAKYIVLEKQMDNINIPFNYPLVVKPVDCNSSKGVKKVKTDAELKEALDNALIMSRTGKAIVEEFKLGFEVSVDVYVQQGIAKIMCITESKKIKNESNFTILKSKYPVSIKMILEQEIQIISDKIADAFNIINGPLLIQLIVGEDSVSVLEFSARMGGGTKYELIKTLSGVDIMKTYVDCIMGINPTIKPIKSHNYVELIYCYCNNGILGSFKGFNIMKTEGIIDDYFQYKTTGMKINKAEVSGDRAAGYLISGNNEEDLENKKLIARRTLQVLDCEGNNILINELL